VLVTARTQLTREKRKNHELVFDECICSITSPQYVLADIDSRLFKCGDIIAK